MNQEIDLGPIHYSIDNHFTEGMEYDLLRSMQHLLENRRVKNLRVRYPMGVKIRLTETVDYLELFGYGLYDSGGNIITREMDVSRAGVEFTARVKDFTQVWNKEFIESVAGIPKFLFALEIGCFEGMTTNYICDNLLLPGGRIICIDPLEDSWQFDDGKLFVGQYERFIRNTRGRPVELQRMKSHEAFHVLKPHNYSFDFIYIDGDHSEDAVYQDTITYFDLCKVGGLILFDDYGFTAEKTKEGIERGLRDRNFEVLKKGYQLLIRRRS